MPTIAAHPRGPYCRRCKKRRTFAGVCPRCAKAGPKRLCRRCGKHYALGHAECSDCRELAAKRSYRNQVENGGQARQRAAARNATDGRIAELAALAEAGLPVVPNRRNRDGPERLEAECYRVHTKH